MKKSLFLSLIASAAALFTSGSANAEMLRLNVSGTFDAISSLNGAEFGADTAFSYTVEFDPVADFFEEVDSGGNLYTTHNFSIAINGTTYTGSGFILGLTDASFAPFGGMWAVGVEGLIGVFNTVSVPYSVANPAPTVFSDYFATAGVPLGQPLSLDGGNSLFVNDVTWATAEIVPEPSAWVMLGVGAPVVLGALRLRKRKA